jgi:hypothetical protein
MNSWATLVMAWRLHRLAIAARLVYLREIGRTAFWEFCNTICQEQTSYQLFGLDLTAFERSHSRAVSRCLEPACDRLTVVIAERAGYARRQPGLLRRVKRMKELQLEAPIHAADHIVHHRHAGFFRRLRILPREVLIDELDKAFGDSHRLALLLDCQELCWINCSVPTKDSFSDHESISIEC